MIDSFTVSKLDIIMPGFKDISTYEQIKFINFIDKEPLFNQLMRDEQPCFLDSNFAARQIKKKQNRQLQAYIKDLISQTPAYQEVCQKIIIYKINAIGFDLSKLNEEEQEYILNLEYSRLPFPENWLSLFFEDSREGMQKIRQNILKNLHDAFGFLFLNQGLEFLYKIHCEILKSTTEAEKKQVLRRYLEQDWGKHSPFISQKIEPVSNYLNDLFKQWTRPARKYLDEMMSAHIFYRFFGISSDNVILGCSPETGLPCVNIFDYYNYHTNRKSIDSLMNVWQTLFKPLRPFFYEYVELAQSEKNIIKICFRAFMPFFIMSMVLALGYAAILPLAYHQLIEYIFFIPAFYFSIIVASQYIQLKNYLYLNLVQWYFGSIHKIHLYEDTPGLNEALQSSELVQITLSYYINCLDYCDTLEQRYAKKSYASLHQQNLALKAELLSELNSFKKTDINPEIILDIIENRLCRDKQQTKSLIYQYQNLFATIDESQIAGFKKEYLALKLKYQNINQLATEISDLKPHEPNKLHF